ncbi:class I adenylate-forming enzyme family protein [Albidovulum sp.]|uniref:class I adenylate-forming enzyme family protein n=1 Tax=Albidovulum sp. TaxID=1872424 RepID=UPI0039B9C0CE
MTAKPPFPSLHAALAAAAAPRLDKVALIHESGNVTYGEMLAKIDNVVRHLRRLGIGKGDIFAVYGQNTLEHYYCFYAASKMGAILVPLNPHLTAAEVGYSFHHSEAKILFHDEHVEATAREGVPADRMLPLTTFHAPCPGADHAGVEIDPEADFVVAYSSGTTGTPKAIVLDQAGLVRVGASAAEMWGITEADTTVIGLPLGYMYGINTASSPVLHAGGTVAMMRRFHPREALEMFRDHGVTIYMGVPTMYTMMMDYCSQRDLGFDLSGMRMLVCSGSPLPPETAARFVGQFGKPLQNYYGLSEAFPIIGHFFHETEDVTPGSTGRLCPGAVVRIQRPDGSECADGEAGEAFVRGPGTMKRYNKNPGMTAAAMQGDLFRTGDIVVRDTKGFYTITGRIKDIIIRGGHNISPAEVEEALVSHPAVREAAVVGAPDPVFGESPVAFVVLRHGARLDLPDLIAHAGKRLSEFKVPQIVHVLAELPVGKTGKIDRRALKDQAERG